jgi:hypothetical protein
MFFIIHISCLIHRVKFKVLTVLAMKTAPFYVTPCSLT